MHLEHLDLRQDVNVDCEFFRVQLPSPPHMDALIVQFTGTSGFGCRNNDDAIYMAAMISAGLISWEPVALILDLRHLAYEWGDMMVQPLCAGCRYYADGADLPTAVVVSDLNRKGLTSLVEMEMGKKTGDWLFETLDDAIQAVDRVPRAWRI